MKEKGQSPCSTSFTEPFPSLVRNSLRKHTVTSILTSLHNVHGEATTKHLSATVQAKQSNGFWRKKFVGHAHYAREREGAPCTAGEFTRPNMMHPHTLYGKANIREVSPSSFLFSFSVCVCRFPVRIKRTKKIRPNEEGSRKHKRSAKFNNDCKCKRSGKLFPPEHFP